MAELDPARGKARQHVWAKHVAEEIAHFSERGQSAVTSAELALHGADSDDPWLAVRGIVYSIREYCDVHPGGRRQILRGAGKDATELFESFHRWVNADALLCGERIGELQGGAFEIDRAELSVQTMLPALLLRPKSSTCESVQLQWRKRTDAGWLLRLSLPRGSCLGWGLVHNDDARARSPAVGMAACRLSTSTSVSEGAVTVFPWSLPSAEGYCDVHVPGPAMDTLEASQGHPLQAGDILYITEDTANKTVSQLGDPGATQLPASVLQKLPEQQRGVVQSGCFTLLQGVAGGLSGKAGAWTAVWPTGTLQGVKSILCIARGDGIGPFLPLLDWASGMTPSRDGCTPLLWLLWDRSNVPMHSRTQALSEHIKAHVQQMSARATGLHKAVVILPLGATSAVSDSASAVGLCDELEDVGSDSGPWVELAANPLVPIASPSGLATLCKDAQAPAPDACQIILCSAGSQAGHEVWLSDWDGVLRSNWYLAAHCLQVNH